METTNTDALFVLLVVLGAGFGVAGMLLTLWMACRNVKKYLRPLGHFEHNILQEGATLEKPGNV